MYFKYRKAGGKCGFAESMQQDRITALKKDETPVEMTDVTETANGIIQKGEAAPQTYPELNYKLGYKAYEKWDTVSCILPNGQQGAIAKNRCHFSLDLLRL